MVRPGDVVVVNFAGATMTKGRPMVVISSARYHHEHPDVIVGLITTNLAAAKTTSDYILQDWKQAGLRKASAFRAYVGTESQSDVQVIGHLSDRDWQGVMTAVRNSIS